MERARWTDDRLDDRMNGMDTTFERVFEEMRADRDRFSSEMRADRDRFSAEMSADRERVIAEMQAGRQELIAEIRAVREQVGQLGFRAAGILAAGLITLVATQL